MTGIMYKPSLGLFFFGGYPMIDMRSRIIIERLIERPAVEQNILLERVALTKRQFDYSIEKINDRLSDFKKPLIENDGVFVRLPGESREFLIDTFLDTSFIESYVMGGEERKKYIFLMMFYYVDEFLSMQHFLEVLEVGKTTFSNDMKNLEAELAGEGLKIHYSRKEGYSLQGDEFTIRYFLIKNVLQDFADSSGRYIYDFFCAHEKVSNFELVRNALDEALAKYDIRLVENRRQEFLYALVLLIPRLDHSFSEFYERYNFSTLFKMKEFAFASHLLKKIHHEDKYSELYICAWMLGISIGNAEEKTSDRSIILELVERITSRFELLAGIRFKNRWQVIQQLYSHFRPSYYRLFFKLPIINPLYKKVKDEYDELFHIVEETLKPTEALFESVIPEEEIAFLTVHFAALLNEFEEYQIRQKIAVIVCPNGIGSSSIVYTELKSTFPEFVFIGPIETKEVYQMEDSFDVIFTTVPNIRLYSLKKPVYVVNPILSTTEKYNLIREVYTEVGSLSFRLPSVEKIMSIVAKNTVIKNKNQLESELYDYLIGSDSLIAGREEHAVDLLSLITPDVIQLRAKARDWEEAIYLAALPLLKKQCIKRTYIEKIIRTIRAEGPYMLITKHVALPHARPEDGALKLAMGITTLAEPVRIGDSENNPMKYIFTLSAIDQKSHINAMAELVSLLEKKEFYQVLDHAESGEEIVAWLKKAGEEKA